MVLIEWYGIMVIVFLMVLIKKYFNYFGILGLVVLERVELEFVADFPEANGELVFGDE